MPSTRGEPGIIDFNLNESHYRESKNQVNLVYLHFKIIF